ncbi:hypothetical protein GCM10029978_094120 [Actinoallomurus acanthiterrae]
MVSRLLNRRQRTFTGIRHWITISGTCNTREEVLKRDGTNVVTDSSCAATSGSRHSPYDGATWIPPPGSRR